MKKLWILMLIGVLMIGCGTPNDNNGTNVNSEESNSGGTTEGQEDAVVPGMEVFAKLPDEFYFSSGAGAWSTTLYLEKDGTFHGQYHDTDAGDIGDDYPNGTVNISNFSGKFAAPTQVNEFTYSTTIEYLNVEREGETYIEDGVRYLVREPYGLTDAGEFLFYMYGTPKEEMAEGFLYWLQSFHMHPEGTLLCYGLYNVNAENGFTGNKIMNEADVNKLGGTYISEAGDKLVILLDANRPENSFDLGEVEWTPSGGEMELGGIGLNTRGGFTISLDESVSYNFELTNDTEGNIEITCINMGKEAVVFKMQ